jgi:hypothetical protein
MKILLEAANIGVNTLNTRSKTLPTIPPMPISFTGEIEIAPFFLYDEVVIDENSIDYIMSEKILSDRSRILIETMIQEKLVIPTNYAEQLQQQRARITLKAEEVYQAALADMIENGAKSVYFESKSEWLEFARAAEQQEGNSIWFKDTEASVKKNLKRIIDNKLIPRDYKYLKENLLDVICNRKLAQLHGMPMYGWSNWSCYYDFLQAQGLQMSKSEHQRKKEMLRAIWTLAFPKLSLAKLEPDAFLKLMQEGHVQEIRRFLETTNLRPEELTEDWFRHIETTLKRKDWGTTAFGVFGVSTSVTLAFAGPIAPAIGAASAVGFFAGERFLRTLRTPKQRLVRTVEKARATIGEAAR